MPEPDDVEGRDDREADRDRAQPRAPGGGEGEDGPRAQRQRVAPAAARAGVDQVRRRPGELVRHPLLDLGERRQEHALHPRQAHQAEQPDEPRPGDEREAEHGVPLPPTGLGGPDARAPPQAWGLTPYRSLLRPSGRSFRDRSARSGIHRCAHPVEHNRQPPPRAPPRPAGPTPGPRTQRRQHQHDGRPALRHDHVVGPRAGSL